MCHKNCFIRECGHLEWYPDYEIKIIEACKASQKVSQKAGGFVPCAPHHQKDVPSKSYCRKCLYGATKPSGMTLEGDADPGLESKAGRELVGGAAKQQQDTQGEWKERSSRK